MSKRSNQFQRIIHSVYLAVNDVGGKVVESVELFERTSGARREIDILAEISAFGERLRLAIEVRDRQKIDDVSWIDELVGKYRDLDVHKVIAVSASGFSSAAITKAMAHSITTFTATQAEEHNWPQEFSRLSVAQLVRSDEWKVTIETDPAGATHLEKDSPLALDCGQSAGTLGECIVRAIEKHRADLAEHLSKNFLSMFKTVADLSRSMLSGSTSTPSSPVSVVGRDGQVFRIVRIGVSMLSTYKVTRAPMRHVQVGPNLASAAEVRDSDDRAIEIFTVQSTKDPGNVFVRVAARPGDDFEKG